MDLQAFAGATVADRPYLTPLALVVLLQVY
jgi:hypothetical protein